jgi:23S rRNA (guanosine2251-2'-O)-methyltransferase
MGKLQAQATFTQCYELSTSYQRFRLWITLFFTFYAMQGFIWVRSLCMDRILVSNTKTYARAVSSKSGSSIISRVGSIRVSRGSCTPKSTATALSQTQWGRVDAGEEGVEASNESFDDGSKQREQLLHDQLLQFTTIDPVKLGKAVLNALKNPTEGYYNEEYGTSALKTYRTYVYPKKQQKDPSHYPPVVSAVRTARQIEFLIKRHRSHQLEWVRHHDTEIDAASSITSERAAAPNFERKRTFPIVLLLDNLRSANNVGSIFRTADACGCAEVITTGITPHPYGSGWQKISKTSLGADTLVPTRHFNTTLQALQSLRTAADKSVFIVGLETTFRSVEFTQIEYPKYLSKENGPTNGVLVVVLGNEVTGIDTEVMPLFDGLIQIPMFGRKNSLNVAACAPVVLYEILRQWGVMEQQKKL